MLPSNFKFNDSVFSSPTKTSTILLIWLSLYPDALALKKYLAVTEEALPDIFESLLNPATFI